MLPMSQFAVAIASQLNSTFTVTVQEDQSVVQIFDGIVTAFLAQTPTQLLLSTALLKESQIPADKVDAFNKICLIANASMPLSTLCIEPINGENYYVLRGTMPTTATPEQLKIEIECLFDNVFSMLDDVQEFLSA